MSAGIHKLPMAAYLADPCPQPSASAGVLETILTRSPLHAKWEHPKLSPAYAPAQSTTFDIGTAAHGMILEGDDKVCVVEADDWRTKIAQAQREEARANGLTPLLRKHYEAVRKMVSVARSFMLECEIAPRIKDAEPELTMLWQVRGFWYRARPDLWSKDRATLVNYKTSESAEPNAFIRRMPSLGCDLSAALYESGAQALGHRAEEFFIAQETSPPYACSLIGLDNAQREIARNKLALAQAIWERCMKEDKWPAYPSRICVGTPSSWELDRDEELRLSFADILERVFA